MIEDLNENQDQAKSGPAKQHPEITGEGSDLAGDEDIQETDTPVEVGEMDQSGDGTEALTQEIENLRDQVADNLDKAIRAQAEMDNLRKRTAREVENAHKYALERFLKEVLPVVDSMELGISAADNAEDINGLKEGMNLTLKMFIGILDKFGVEVIDPKGEKFDPQRHEAVSMHALEGHDSGTVIEVMQKGYSLNGRLVRPAMVVVAQ